MKETSLNVERLESKRSRLLLANLAGFILWDGSRIVDVYLLTDTVLVLSLVELAGWALWIVSLILIVRLTRKIAANRKINSILNDELTVQNRLRAWRSAFIALILTNSGLIAASIFWTYSGAFSAELTIFVGVASAMASFIYYSDFNNGGD